MCQIGVENYFSDPLDIRGGFVIYYRCCKENKEKMK